MGIAEFEENFAVAMIVGQCETEDGRKNIAQRRGVKRAIELENADVHSDIPFDPASATPEELDRWLRSMQANG